MNHIAFRVDSSNQIGSGHVMRCLALAEEFLSQGCSVSFHCYELTPFTEDQLNRRAVPIQKLNSLHDSTSFRDCEWLVVDHYQFSAEEERAIANTGKKILAIDDIGRQHYCHLLMDQNLYSNPLSRYEGKCAPFTQFALGPQFALIRKEFADFKRKLPPSQLNSILVTLGGSNQGEKTEKILDALSQKTQLQISAPKNALNMAQLISTTDLVIGAGGSTNWERCFIGTPAILTTIAENQIEIARALAEAGTCFNVGSWNNQTPLRIQECVAQILATPLLLQSMAQASQKLVDGKGTKRVVEMMKGLN